MITIAENETIELRVNAFKADLTKGDLKNDPEWIIENLDLVELNLSEDGRDAFLTWKAPGKTTLTIHADGLVSAVLSTVIELSESTLATYFSLVRVGDEGNEMEIIRV